jgi:hypothetical protein
LSAQDEKLLAEQTFKLCIDIVNKEKVVNKLGHQICQVLRIDPDQILIKKQEHFAQEYPDEELADLHFRHY